MSDNIISMFGYFTCLSCKINLIYTNVNFVIDNERRMNEDHQDLNILVQSVLSYIYYIEQLFYSEYRRYIMLTLFGFYEDLHYFENNIVKYSIFLEDLYVYSFKCESLSSLCDFFERNRLCSDHCNVENTDHKPLVECATDEIDAQSALISLDFDRDLDLDQDWILDDDDFSTFDVSFTL